MKTKKQKETRTLILKQGGKKALKEFNDLNRVRTNMRTGTITHQDKREKERGKVNYLDPKNW